MEKRDNTIERNAERHPKSRILHSTKTTMMLFEASSIENVLF